MNETLPLWQLCAGRPAPPTLPDHQPDELTGLPTRDTLCEAVRRRILEPTPESTRFAVLAIAPRDAALAAELMAPAALRLRRAIRIGDLAARISATAFGLLLPRIAAPREAEAAARRLSELLGEAFLVEGHRVSGAWRSGIAAYPADGHEAEALLRHAEAALQRALAGT